jgi:hypothetical protein
MPNNPNTDEVEVLSPPLECSDWKLAFEPFEGNAFAALRTAFNIRTLHNELDSLLIKPIRVMEALDHAMEVLFPYTDFHKASFEMFLKYTDANLTFDEEQMLNALGVKI